MIVKFITICINASQINYSFICSYERIQQKMEDYVIVGAVLQAMHMSKFKKKPKHLKKYELTSCTTYLPHQNKSAFYEMGQKINHSQRLSNKIARCSNIKVSRRNSQQNNQKNKLKIKFILDDAEKISDKQINEGNKNCFNQFFTKREIQPKLSKQHTSRTITLIKTPDLMNGFFYDTNIQLTRKKSRKCVILPQRKQLKLQVAKQPNNNIDIRKMVKQQWEEQRLKRKAQCQTTSSCLGRRKNSMQRQTKKIQQEIKYKENQERQQKSSVNQRSNYRRISSGGQNYHENVLPLSKDQIKTKTVSIMHKYGLDTAKCYMKII